MEWGLFKIWLEIEGIDMDKLSWQQTQILIKSFENDVEQNAFNYRLALQKQAELKPN